MTNFKQIQSKIAELDTKIAAELDRKRNQEAAIREKILLVTEEIPQLQAAAERARVLHLRRNIMRSKLEQAEADLQDAKQKRVDLLAEQRSFNKASQDYIDLMEMKKRQVRQLNSTREVFAAGHKSKLVEQFKSSDPDLDFFQDILKSLVATGANRKDIETEISKILIDELLGGLPERSESVAYVDQLLIDQPDNDEEIPLAA